MEFVQSDGIIVEKASNASACSSIVLVPLLNIYSCAGVKFLAPRFYLKRSNF
ncbi:hypothetical protein Hanom_Chr02g00108661 [Helianthus anomalus]